MSSAAKEHGLLLSGVMSLAHGAGRKWMTRRVLTDRNVDANVKPSQCDLANAWVDPGFPDKEGVQRQWYLKAHVLRDRAGDDISLDNIVERLHLRYRVGDRIWFRETMKWGGGMKWHYAGDNAVVNLSPNPRQSLTAHAWAQRQSRPSVPSIHMPRWAARYTPLITKVRVGRIQDISEADARAEGVPPNWMGDLAGFNPDEHGWLTPAGLANVAAGHDCDEDMTIGGEVAYCYAARDAFSAWWDSLNGDREGGKYSWNANPWVIVLEYEPYIVGDVPCV